MKGIEYLVFASLLAGLPLTSMPCPAALAGDECLSAPSRLPPEGSHWYYRVDRTSNHKCWYVAPTGEKMRSVAPQLERRMPITRPAAKSANGVENSEQAAEPVRAAAPIAERPQGNVQGNLLQSVQPNVQGKVEGEVQDVVISGPWPDPTKAGAGITIETTSPEAGASRPIRWPRR
jgi:hypothetical protein